MERISHTAHRVLDAIVDELGSAPEGLTSESTLESLKFDSLDFIGLVVKIEEAFGVSIPENDLIGFRTVGDIANWLESQ